jgi:hypothetical protein
MSDISNDNAYLGSSNWEGDASLTGTIDEFRIYNEALDAQAVMDSFLAGPVPIANLRLEINTVSGAVTIVTDNALPTTIDYYAIRSAQQALSIDGWNSLEAQDFDASGPGAGESWEVADLSDASQLGELYLLGGSEVASDASLELGQAFNPAVFGLGNDGDLTFEAGIQGSGLITGEVVYITPDLPDGDYNGDFVVDGVDFLRWQRGLSFNPLSDADLQTWEANFGMQAAQASGAAVPEPTALAMLLVAVSVVIKRRVS